MATDIRLHAGERGVLLGKSGTGKSTLAKWLLDSWLSEYPSGRVLIIDTKPRFRADYDVSGNRITYKGWVSGDTMRNSVAIHRSSELRWALKISRCAIFQKLTPDRKQVANYRAVIANLAADFFRMSGPKKPTLFYVDEFYDVCHGNGGYVSESVLQVMRAGREVNQAGLFGAQRPKSIPLPTLTEASCYYIFFLEYEDDVKYLRKHGPAIARPARGFEFNFIRSMRGGQKVEVLATLPPPKQQRKVA